MAAKCGSDGRHQAQADQAEQVTHVVIVQFALSFWWKKVCFQFSVFNLIFFIHLPPELLPVLGPLERYMTLTLDTALQYNSRAGSDLGQTLVL